MGILNFQFPIGFSHDDIAAKLYHEPITFQFPIGFSQSANLSFNVSSADSTFNSLSDSHVKNHAKLIAQKLGTFNSLSDSHI